MAIKDDDLLYVQRPSGPDAGEYKLTAGNLKTDLNDEYLSKKVDDTAAGEITFKGKTTHEDGVKVTGGDFAEVGTGLAANSSGLHLCHDDTNMLRISNNKSYNIISSGGQLSTTASTAAVQRILYGGTHDDTAQTNISKSKYRTK